METRGIGEVAAQLGLDADTLRWFERQGVVPDPKRDTGGRRRYTQSDVSILEVLLHLRGTGMPLAQIAEFTSWVARNPEGIAERLQLLTEHRERVLADRQRIDKSLAVIDHKISTYAGLLTGSTPHI